jgi:hypothetical protein
MPSFNTDVKDILNTRQDDASQSSALREVRLGSVLDGLSRPTIDAANRTVTADVCAMEISAGIPAAGVVLSVHATVGGSAGPKAKVLTGVPAAGQVLITYNATTGQPTLTFAAADAITACRVEWVDTGRHDDKSLRERLATGHAVN